MTKILGLVLAAAALLTACGSPAASNSNGVANAVNANIGAPVKLDPANMPPGLSGSPLPVNGVPGIPANGAVIPKGTTPTPGIPSAEQIKKGLKPGTTPTPGIPDPATIRKAMGLPPLSNVNAKVPGNGAPVPKSKKPSGGRPQ